MTATCKFSCFDNPGKTSAGELVLLNPEGGAIALLTTTRLVYAFPNYKLNENFMNIFCEKNNGEFPTLGQLFKKTKVLSGSNTNSRNFTLLGDPALRLSYPKYIVSTTNISDTLKALEEVEISGKVTDDDGNLLVDFNGILYPTIYDKEIISLTLGQESCSPMPFRNQNNIIYKGEASVSNGEFSFSFIVPKDIENKWYSHWENEGYFYSEPDDREPYTIVIPPPNVTGVLHLGHTLNNTLQDVLVRKARMEGKNACWVPGTDHASIATETKVVEMLKEKGIRKEDISREEFMKYAWEWKDK
jgi:hypothetical protein